MHHLCTNQQYASGEELCRMTAPTRSADCRARGRSRRDRLRCTAALVRELLRDTTGPSVHRAAMPRVWAVPGLRAQVSRRGHPAVHRAVLLLVGMSWCMGQSP